MYFWFLSLLPACLCSIYTYSSYAHCMAESLIIATSSVWRSTLLGLRKTFFALYRLLLTDTNNYVTEIMTDRYTRGGFMVYSWLHVSPPISFMLKWVVRQFGSTLLWQFQSLSGQFFIFISTIFSLKWWIKTGREKWSCNIKNIFFSWCLHYL